MVSRDNIVRRYIYVLLSRSLSFLSWLPPCHSPPRAETSRLVQSPVNYNADVTSGMKLRNENSDRDS